jgi:hypothetical protein
MKRIAVLVFAIFCPLTGWAAFVDGNKLHEWLEADGRIAAGKASSNDDTTAAEALGYVQGVIDQDNHKTVCLPSRVSLGQAEAIVKKYVDAHPEHWQSHANFFVLAALYDAFPCTKQGN